MSQNFSFLSRPFSTINRVEHSYKDEEKSCKHFCNQVELRSFLERERKKGFPFYLNWTLVLMLQKI